MVEKSIHREYDSMHFKAKELAKSEARGKFKDEEDGGLIGGQTEEEYVIKRIDVHLDRMLEIQKLRTKSGT